MPAVACSSLSQRHANGLLKSRSGKTDQNNLCAFLNWGLSGEPFLASVAACDRPKTPALPQT